ncbi:MAG TPA: hypothetical protein VJU18_03315 [Vicinamibacteria bacterium]|nr:hypothetical protein [Vicinamibacteria bacterium]
MPIACRNKIEHGTEFCREDCPASGPEGVFRYVRVETPADLPPAEERIIDVAILDMNHGWPNLGHDSLVHAILDAGCDLIPLLEDAGLQVRAISFDIRRQAGIPEAPGDRFAVYVGTGGPGHLDPRCNQGGGEGSQGIHEDPSWEAPMLRLFDQIRASPEAALLGVCHTFGVMCRWAGIAEPVLRGPEKGGKSTGLLENLLTPEAERHPWFARFAEELPPSRRLRIVDNRLYDLIPRGGTVQGAIPIGYETLGVGGPRGNALTMAEFARDREGFMPRVFGVNHHPEIVDRARQRLILQQKQERGEVSAEWVAERAEILTRTYPDENSDQRLHLTSDFTLLGPLRFHLYRQVRRRAEALGLPIDLHEERILEHPVQAVWS